ncbi:MAG: hypothetical protein KBF75_14545 [Saprospiraceae bacterium]|nr:hypothetical protein [Saprospiraceae bacterium]MBK7606186.1 hypothetical protein [Saprospiraceae bacterium]MBP7801844.1 hypothetical protein [Saprospiraceae bacterium]MBP8095345.1 hypothetical protein [Saprospiraceae bacterium]MBP9135243.1 hypothetical protein [Saprospiraceae bacterium]
MKSFTLTLSLIFVLSMVSHLYAESFPDCSATSGNSVIRRSGIGLNISLDSECSYTIPDMRSYWISRSGTRWRTYGVLRQIPAPGSVINIESGVCINQVVNVLIIGDFFNNGGTPYFTADDQYCSIYVNDSYNLFDKTPPPIRDMIVYTNNVAFTSSDLTSKLYNEFQNTDNCSTFLRVDLLPKSDWPKFIFDCRGKNSYRIPFQLTDGCGNHSRVATANIYLVDTIAPISMSLYGPGFFYVNGECRYRIRQEDFTPITHDDLTADGDLRYSFRVISPVAYEGNIPPGGKWIDADGSCIANSTIRVRVCAQDCSGNGDLHLKDNGLSSNCNYLDVILKDTLAPRIRSGCGKIVTLFANCTAVMPNLASTLSIAENCSAISIYQLPKPGNILNDGVENYPGLASGVERIFTCSLPNQPDPIVSCKSSSPIFKSISVSFIIVDCDGNCTIKENCITLNLSTSADIAGLGSNISGSTSRSANFSENSLFQALEMNMTNLPNPFYNHTDIQIKSVSPGKGSLQFYSLNGQQLYSRTMIIHQGVNTVSINKNDLHISGLVFYSFELWPEGADHKSIMWNKMLLMN